VSALPPAEPSEDKEALQESAAEWGERFEREGQRIRLGCGAVLGFFAGIAVLAKMVDVHSWVLALAVIGGCMIAAGLAFRRSDDEGSQMIEWLVWPEWKLLERLPLWALVLILAIVATCVLGFLVLLGIRLL
jgi:hypothetical protein